MNQEERRRYLIEALQQAYPAYQRIEIPAEAEAQWRLLRGLMNVRLPGPVSEEFLKVQDAYLQQELAGKKITSLADLEPVQPGLYLWQGDITTLACDAIVNAANSGMTGCYQPNHNCIDNCIHTYAGVQLRQDCQALMDRQGHEEPTGQAKVTRAYNLPCQYVIHTVGPIVSGPLTKRHCDLLAQCYRACLAAADAHQMSSIAFCCISTGVFCFPNRRAAEIAVETVKQYQQETGSKIEVIFNVFQNQDAAIYREILQGL